MRWCWIRVDLERHAGEGNGILLQCSCLENPRDRGAWWAAFYGVTQSRTRLKRLGGSSREAHSEKAMERHRQKLEKDMFTSQGTWGILPVTLKAGRSNEGFSSKLLVGNTALLKPWFETSCLQKCKRTYFCCFQPPGLQQFVTAALGS